MSSLSTAQPGGPTIARRPIALPRWIQGLRPGVALAVLVIAFFVAAVIAPSLLASRGPFAVDLAATLKAPSIHHIFGTDESGRDLYSRVVYGARESLLIGLGATALSVAIATVARRRLRAERRPHRRCDQPRHRGALLLPGAAARAAFRRGLRAERDHRDSRGRSRHGAWLRAHDPRPGAGGTRLRLRRIGSRARASPQPRRAAPHIPQRNAAAGRDRHARRGPVNRVGLGPRLPWPWRAAALAGVGGERGTNFVTQAWWLEVMPGLAIVLFALSLTTLGRSIQQKLEGGLTR